MTEDLHGTIAGGETERVEFKRAPTSLERDVAAMLNTSGGNIFIGIDDDGAVVGVEDGQSVASSIERELRQRISPPASVSVTVITHEGHDVVAIDVPMGQDGPYVASGTITVRKGSATVAAVRDDIDTILGVGAATRWERRACLGASLDDLDVTRIEIVARRARERWGLPEVNTPLEALESFHLARDEVIFNGAVVLFARHPASFFPQIRVRAAAFSSERSLDDNRVFEGNLFELLDESMGFLHRALAIRSEITAEHIERHDSPAIPRNVLREALLNAFVHRDYASYSGGVSIVIQDDTLTIWNSGQLPHGMTLDDLRIGQASRPGNPDIAHVMFMMGFIERIGLGTQFILKAYEEQLLRPDWHLDSGGVRLVLPMMQAWSRYHPNTRQALLLENMQPGATSTVAKYAENFASNVSRRQARTDLAELVDRGFLERRGAGRSTIYVRTQMKNPRDDSK